MRKVVYIIICLFLLVGCSTRKSQKEQVADVSLKEQLKDEKIEFVHEDTVIAEIPSTEVVEPKLSVEKVSAISNKQINITYKGKDRTRIVKTTDIFKNIRYVPLETNDASLLSSDIYSIIYRNDNIYIHDLKNSGNIIHLYDSNGKYIRDIGRRGEGPEDYLGTLHMAVNNKGMVAIPDRMRSEIITYTKEGKFVSRIRLDSVSIYKNIFLNDSLLLVKSLYNRPGHLFHIVDVSNKKVVRTYQPIKNRMYMVIFPESMTDYHGKILVSGYQSNEILEVTLDGVKVRYVININDKMPPEGFWEQKASSYSEIADAQKRMGYIGHIPCFAENDHSIFFYFRGSLERRETIGLALIDKTSGKSQAFRQIELAENVVVSPDFFYPCENGKIIIAVSPETILNSGNQEFISQFPNLKEDDNPILMFAEIK